MVFTHFVSDDRLDGDGGQAQFVDVVPQHGIFLIFGGRSERNIHAQAQRQVGINAVGAVKMGCEHHVFGDFPLGFPLHAAAPYKRRFRIVIFDVRGDDIGGSRYLAAVQFGQTGRIVENRGGIGGFCGGGIGRSLRGNRLCTEMVARSLSQRGQCGSRQYGNCFHSFHIFDVS